MRTPGSGRSTGPGIGRMAAGLTGGGVSSGEANGGGDASAAGSTNGSARAGFDAGGGGVPGVSHGDAPRDRFGRRRLDVGKFQELVGEIRLPAACCRRQEFAAIDRRGRRRVEAPYVAAGGGGAGEAGGLSASAVRCSCSIATLMM
jgi:hypothetical protein